MLFVGTFKDADLRMLYLILEQPQSGFLSLPSRGVSLVQIIQGHCRLLYPHMHSVIQPYIHLLLPKWSSTTSLSLLAVVMAVQMP